MSGLEDVWDDNFTEGPAAKCNTFTTPRVRPSLAQAYRQQQIHIALRNNRRRKATGRKAKGGAYVRKLQAECGSIGHYPYAHQGDRVYRCIICGSINPNG